MSGGRATIGLKTGKDRSNQAGDITAIDPVGAWLTDRFIIENKHYSDLDITSGILSNTGKLHKFWIDLVEVSQRINKMPLLIAKENHRPVLLISSVKGEVCLRLDPQTAIAILPLWHNARVYLFQTLLSTTCMALGNHEHIPRASHPIT